MLAAARGLDEIIANRRTQIVQDRDFLAFFSGDVLGVPTLVVIFALVAVAGWVLLNRTTFGRRTLDRKSTCLNSSHANISYAVFCLKKKKLILCTPSPFA